ncbi:hypothetical protein BDQ17DRAFT_1344093 [Cyathus striatus]|nr:hypothetical protein BDQ17DRAFT_1344093 [Cyathus striatus]
MRCIDAWWAKLLSDGELKMEQREVKKCEVEGVSYSGEAFVLSRKRWGFSGKLGRARRAFSGQR